MDKSEFPQTKYSKVGKKIGWIFSPVLLIALIAFTIFLAEGLKFDFESRSIERNGGIEIKDLKNASVFLDGKEVGKSPNVFDVSTDASSEVKVVKQGRLEWKKSVLPKAGFVKTYFPILFPQEITFASQQIEANNIYTNNSQNYFFYEKKELTKTNLYKYSVNKQIFGSSVSNDLYLDLTTILPNTVTEKDYDIIPANNGKSILIVVYGQKLVIADERGITLTIPNIIPQVTDTFLWSPNDSYLLYKNYEDIYSIQANTGRVIVLHKPQNKEERNEIQFLLEPGFVYKSSNSTVTDLIQNSYDTSNPQKIELPNIDNIRKTNLKKAYNLLLKQNLILIQTQENIFSYNILTSEMKKFNLYKNEEIVLTDSENERVLTRNKENVNQFIFYDLDQDEKKVFTLDKTTNNEAPEKILSYNIARNLVLDYQTKIEFIDIDGSNHIVSNIFNSPDVVLSAKVDTSVHVVVKDLNTAPSGGPLGEPGRLNKYILRIEKFEN